ncbi:hypothetical protein QO200_18810 [Flavobacterium sp. Arc3]|uniref:DUF6624 domain-containing protein n=1 Tax=Flavobacterium sp. Arc3 TaxID=3046686 RepID=UPI00352DF241
MNKITFLALFATILTSYGQNYDDLIKKADSCYEIKNYTISTAFFEKAFKTKPELKENFYNAACAASLANDKKNSLKWLETAINNGFDNLNHINTDSDLDNVRNEKKFNKIISDLQKKTELVEAKYDKPLQKELLEILKEDQEIRNQYFSAQKKYGYQGKEMDSLGKIMVLKDSLNLKRIVKILDEKGWAGKDVVGQQANQTVFLVIQHSNLKIQQRYLPMMREAVKKGNANSDSLALLEDRVALRQGRKQIYGSQVGTNPVTKTQYVLPLEDPDNVDKRRAEVGLDPLSDYVKFWNIVWDIDQYKKDLPEIEKMSKQKN